jgi:hypothetical protein
MPLTSSRLRWWRRRRARRYTESRRRLCRLSRYRRGMGRHLDLPVIALSREEAGDHFGWRAAFLSLDLSAPLFEVCDEPRGTPGTTPAALYLPGAASGCCLIEATESSSPGRN